MNQEDAKKVANCIDALIIARQTNFNPQSRDIQRAQERLFKALYTHDELTQEQHNEIMNDVFGPHGQG